MLGHNSRLLLWAIKHGYNYRGFLQAAVPSKSRLGRQKGLAAV